MGKPAATDRPCLPSLSHSFTLDFIITGISQEVLEEEVKPLVTEFLWERGLELSEEKTRITHIEEGFDFLGQHPRKYNGHFIITPSKKNVKAFLTDIRKVIKDSKDLSANNLINLGVWARWCNSTPHESPPSAV